MALEIQTLGARAYFVGTVAEILAGDDDVKTAGVAFATDGLKGEETSSGTGNFIYYDGSNWFRSDTGAGVAVANPLIYAAGTWAPILSDGTNVDATQTVAVGTYTRIGQMVHVKCKLTTSSLGAVSGNLQVNGLPFTSATLANSDAVVNVSAAAGLAITILSSLGGSIAPNTTAIILNVWDATTGTTIMQDTEWTADGSATFEATYYV